MTSHNTGYQSAHRAKESRYLLTRKGGLSANQAALALALTQTAAGNFEAAWRAQTFAGGRDTSCPAFAYDAAHLAKIGPVGFPIMRGRALVSADGQPWRAA